MLSLLVLSPDTIILKDDNISSVGVRLCDDTLLTLYPGHAPLLAEILPGILTYTVDEQQRDLDLPAGILQVSQNHINIFVDQTQTDDEDENSNHLEQFDVLSRTLMQSLDERYLHGKNNITS